MEDELKDAKKSLEFGHAEIQEMKDENTELKKSEHEMKKRMLHLEEQNTLLNNRAIDLQARQFDFS